MRRATACIGPGGGPSSDQTESSYLLAALTSPAAASGVLTTTTAMTSSTTIIMSTPQQYYEAHFLCRRTNGIVMTLWRAAQRHHEGCPQDAHRFSRHFALLGLAAQDIVARFIMIP